MKLYVLSVQRYSSVKLQKLTDVCTWRVGRGEASLRPATTIQTSVKFRDIEELYLRGDEWSMKIFNCSQNLNECSLSRAPQIFAVARMIAFLSVLLEIL